MAQQGYTYSFLDVQATINGPAGANVSLGSGANVGDEGITVEASEETNTMHVGADGGVAHSLHASRAGRILVRLLKTSPTNQQLMQMYNAQRVSSLLHGQNTIVIDNFVTGDKYIGEQCAFGRNPTNSYSKEAGIVEWEFQCARINQVLGGAGLLIT